MQSNPTDPRARAVWAAPPIAISGDQTCLAPRGLISQRTVRNIVTPSSGGTRIRIRVSNRFGSGPLPIGATTIAPAGDLGALSAAPTPVHFAGRAAATLSAGAEAVSDWVDFNLQRGRRVAVSLFVAGIDVLATFHKQASQDNWLSGPGDHTRSRDAEDFEERTTCWLFLTGLEIDAGSSDEGTIVAFGDSITDGTGSTQNANERWPDHLARRIHESTRASGRVVNAGIAGNSLLVDGGNFGEAGVRRFRRDVLAQPGVAATIVLLGVNDIGFTSLERAQRGPAPLIAGLQKLVRDGHDHGVQVLAGTIMPFKGVSFAGFWNPSGEKIRREVNDWILHRSDFDSTIDFAAAVADPEDPELLLRDYDSGDGIHPNDHGYRAMADAIDLGSLDTRRATR